MESVVNRARCFAAVVVSTLLLAVLSPLQAQTESGGQRFDDWVVHCDSRAEDRINCIMSQMAVVSETGEQLMRINIRYLPAAEQTLMQFVLPLGVALRNQPRLTLGTDDVSLLQYDICLTDGCYITFELGGDVLERLLSMRSGQLDLEAGSGEPLSLPISGSGSRAAFNAMRRLADALYQRQTD